MRRSLLVSLLISLLIVVPGEAFAQKNQGKGKPGSGGGTTTAASALILYDTTGPYGHLGELYATMTANLLGRFGSYVAKPTTSYTAGEVAKYPATIYIGSTYGEPIPSSFMTDVLSGNKPVIWMGHGIHELAQHADTLPDATFQDLYGWYPGLYDHSQTVTGVRYKGTRFDRRAQGNSALTTYSYLDTARVTEVATAISTEGNTFPWAVRSRNLTYIGEIPFSYATERDRYIVFSDMLFDTFAPTTATRHRALVRLEDVGPDADPQRLRQIADYLASQKIPFSFGVYAEYRDPKGIYNDGVPESFTLKETPAVVSALKYMQSKGGVMLMHGYTHQFGNLDNPYNGVSGDDFEFFTAHVDADDYVRLDGPVPGDSKAWANSRVDAANKIFKAVGLAEPTIFEFPHYAASAIDYEAIGARFAARYERGLYFGGYLSKRQADYSLIVGQFFPYPVTDVYGSKVLPENIGNYEPFEYNNHPTRFPIEIIDNARLNLAVRDGFASFFYHPFLGLDALKETVEGIKALGYTFVSPTSL